MPNARRSRTLAASVEDLWELICDPHHLPRWWPRVERVEDVQENAFTEVMKTRKGKLVRADYSVVERDEALRSVTWSQQIAGTPFAKVLSAAETQLWIAPPETATVDGLGEPETAMATRCEVTIELRQTMVGYSDRSSGMFMGMAPRFGSVMVRRAAAATIEQALDGLERIGG